MGSRSRKRGKTTRAPVAAPVTAQDDPTSPPPNRAARTEAKNQAIRDGLPPLGPGDRLPASLLVAIVITGLAGVANLVAYALGLEVNGERPNLAGIASFSGIMLIMAVGMALRRYWAVLGFEALLAIIVVIFSILLLTASNLLAVAVCLAFIAGPGFLFFKLIRVMARIQMPERPGARGAER